MVWRACAMGGGINGSVETRDLYLVMQAIAARLAVVRQMSRLIGQCGALSVHEYLCIPNIKEINEMSKLHIICC